MILGIDYGRVFVGLSISSGTQAEGLMTVHRGEAVSRIGIICNHEQIDRIVIGIPEGKMKVEVEQFGKELREKLEKPIVYFDETLTSKHAQEVLHLVGMTRKKKQLREHVVAATLILQSYLDDQKTHETG